jgi:hypothetical protein
VNGRLPAVVNQTPTPTVGVDQLLTERQAAVSLLVSIKTLQAWRVQGRNLPFVRIGRRVAYRVQDINDFIERNRFASTSEADVACTKSPTTGGSRRST